MAYWPLSRNDVMDRARRTAKPGWTRSRPRGKLWARRLFVTLLLDLLTFGALAESGQPVSSVQCGGTDDTAVVEAAVATLAASTTSFALQVHGHCVITEMVSQTLHRDVAISGDGPGVTSFTFSQATDGFHFQLSHEGGHWGGIRLSGMSVIRALPRPMQANTAIAIVADPAAGVNYSGNSGMSDIFVGGNAQASGWAAGIDLQSVTNFEMRNVTVRGPLATGPGADRGVAVSGSSLSMYAVQVDLTDCNIIGFSTGIFVTGFVQGIFVINGSIIGDWRGIDWHGISAGTVYKAASTTPPGKAILVSPADATRLSNGMVAEGDGIAPTSMISTIDARNGRVVLSPAPTGLVTSGQDIVFHSYYVAEALNVTNSTFSASHRDILNSWGAFVQITNSSFLRFRTTASDWAAIELDESNNNTVIGNNILGKFTGNENGVIINSVGGQGHAPSVVSGNVINGVTGAGIQLGGLGSALVGGTIRNIVVTGNNVYAAAAAVRSSLHGAASVYANRLNDQLIDPTLDRPLQATPHVIGCGEGASVTGSDLGGEITVGSGTVESCTLAFGLRWETPPACAANTDRTTVSVATAAHNAAGYMFRFSASLGGGHVYYVCQRSVE